MMLRPSGPLGPPSSSAGWRGLAAVGMLVIWACSRATITPAQLTDPSHAISTPVSAGSPNTSTPISDTNNVIDGIVQGGTGWKGDVNVAATSKDYLGLSLDALIAKGSPMVDELKKHPDVEAAIRQVSQETGVPAGLLAGLCYQESSFDNNAYSKNPNPSSQDSADVGISQAPLEDFEGDTWKDPLVNLRDFVTKQGFLDGYKKHESWGYVLRLWNSGQVVDPNDLRKEQGNTDPNYLTEILGTHCMGKD